MDAKEALHWMEHDTGIMSRNDDAWPIAIRALRLLAAAGGGEGLTVPAHMRPRPDHVGVYDEVVLASDYYALAARVRELEGALVEQRDNKDGAYLERNRLVALLASMFPSGIKRTAIEGWSADWNGCVYIDFPWGQASWHYHDSHAFLFDHLPQYQGSWDGHTTDQKYAAIAARSK